MFKSVYAKAWALVAVSAIVTAVFEEIVERRILKKSGENWDKALEEDKV